MSVVRFVPDTGGEFGARGGPLRLTLSTRPLVARAEAREDIVTEGEQTGRPLGRGDAVNGPVAAWRGRRAGHHGARFRRTP